MKDYGWITIHRKIKDHWIFQKNKTKTEFEAWIIMLMEVNHKDEKVLIGNTLIECKRGQSVKSQKTWAKLFGWDRSRVRRFFTLLKTEQMLSLKSTNKMTILTILNYDIYQNNRTSNEHQKNKTEQEIDPLLSPKPTTLTTLNSNTCQNDRTSNEHQMNIKRTSRGQKMNTNNNDLNNNDNNININKREGKIQKMWIKTFGRNPKIPEIEVTEELIKKFGEEKAEIIMKNGVRKNFQSIFTLIEQLNEDGTIKPKEKYGNNKTIIGAQPDELAELIRARADRQSGN